MDNKLRHSTTNMFRLFLVSSWFLLMAVKNSSELELMKPARINLALC